MGKAMSALVSTAVRPLRDYNVEQRAHKVISQSKPKAAPKYESNEKELARILKENPEILEETSKRDVELDKRLKEVFVTTSHIVDQKRVLNPDRPLPTNTNHVGFFELGFKETEVTEIPTGKCSLRQSVKFIEDYRMNPEEWTKEKIAQEYKLNVEDVKNVLDHYRLFAVSIPEKGKEKKPLLKTSYDTKTFNKYLKDIKEKTGQETALLPKIKEFLDKENKNKN